MAAALELCPDCGVALPRHDGAPHPYMGGSAACWHLYGTILAREYGSPRLMRVHRLTVDAYAAQHPGRTGRRAARSVWLHLAGLYVTIGRGGPPGDAQAVIGTLAARRVLPPWLDPPAGRGAVTLVAVADAVDDDAHERAVRAWAASVWAAWRPHHAAVAALVDPVAGWA